MLDEDKTQEHTNLCDSCHVYLNSALIAWLSKKQATIETSVFGTEFVAMKIGMETLRGLRYKLRMMGAPLAGS